MPRLVIRGYGARASRPTPPIEGATFFDGLRAYLKSREELAEITEVYYRTAKPGVAFPYLIVAPIGDTPELNNEETYLERAEIQFSVIATGSQCDEDAERLGQGAYRALAPKQLNDAGTVASRAKITSTYARETTALPGMKHRAEQPGRGQGSQRVVAFHFQYLFLVDRSMVVLP